MDMNDMILISIDDHVIEPPDAFRKHMPAAYKSRTPFAEDINGIDHWNFDGKRLVVTGLNAVAGRPRDEYGIEAVSFRDRFIHPVEFNTVLFLGMFTRKPSQAADKSHFVSNRRTTLVNPRAPGTPSNSHQHCPMD